MPKIAISAAGGAMPRRGFLRQLCGLPLLGGEIILLGAPTAVAEPVTEPLLDAYFTFLNTELNLLGRENPQPMNLPMLREQPPVHIDHPLRIQWARDSIAAHDEWIQSVEERLARNEAMPIFARPPSTRAALVLSSVGFEWRAR